MAVPIDMTQNKSFSSSWAPFQFFIGTPSWQLFYSQEMMDEQLAVILHHIFRVICNLNRNRKSHLWFNNETDQHLGDIRKKRQKEKWLFVAMAHVSCQNFHQRSLWVRPVIRPDLRWQTLYLMSNSGMRIFKLPEIHFNSY